MVKRNSQNSFQHCYVNTQKTKLFLEPRKKVYEQLSDTSHLKNQRNSEVKPAKTFLSLIILEEIEIILKAKEGKIEG